MNPRGGRSSRLHAASAALATVSALLLLTAAALGVVAATNHAHAYRVWFETSVNGVAFSVVGAVLTRRRPENPVSWLFATLGLLAASQLAVGQWAQDGFASLVPGGAAAAFVATVVAPGSLLAVIATLLVLFPDGRPPTPRWTWLLPAAGLLAGVNVATLVVASKPYDDFPGHGSPFAVGSAVAGALARITDDLTIVVLGAAIVSCVVRWRLSHGERRQQLKPFMLAAVLWPLAFVVILFTPVNHTVVWPHIIFGLAVAGLTAGAAVSVLRYRLYDIDRVVSRAVSYLVITGLLLGAYTACVALMTEALPFSSAVGTAASTLAAAALFHPLRRRVQAAVDRRFNRARYDAIGTVDAFSGRLRDQVDTDVVRADLVSAVARSVQPAHLSLWAPESR